MASYHSHYAICQGTNIQATFVAEVILSEIQTLQTKVI